MQAKFTLTRPHKKKKMQAEINLKREQFLHQSQQKEKEKKQFWKLKN